MAARTTISMPTRVPDIRKGDTVVVLGRQGRRQARHRRAA